jgi:hypothetical protein
VLLAASPERPIFGQRQGFLQVSQFFGIDQDSRWLTVIGDRGLKRHAVRAQ